MFTRRFWLASSYFASHSEGGFEKKFLANKNLNKELNWGIA